MIRSSGIHDCGRVKVSKVTYQKLADRSYLQIRLSCHGDVLGGLHGGSLGERTMRHSGKSSPAFASLQQPTGRHPLHP